MSTQENAVRAASVVVAFLWHAIRLPCLAALLALEPVVLLFASVLTTLGVGTAIFFRFIVHLADFPFWSMLGMSVGCAGLLVPYYMLIALFELPRED